MKVGDKVQLRRRISQKGGKTRLATEKVTILGIYPYHVQVRNQKGIVRSYINWEWQQLTSKEGMEGVESWRRKGQIMTEKEVCLMCENYSEDTKCDQHDSCKLMAVLKENRALKKKVSQLKRQLDESELKRSYMVNPNAIGYRNDMGW